MIKDREPTKEQAWKEEARKAYQDQQSQDNEGGCREPIGFVQGYLAAKKSDFEEIKTLKERLAKAEKVIRADIGYNVFEFHRLREEYLKDKQGDNE